MRVFLISGFQKDLFGKKGKELEEKKKIQETSNPVQMVGDHIPLLVSCVTDTFITQLRIEQIDTYIF